MPQTLEVRGQLWTAPRGVLVLLFVLAVTASAVGTALAGAQEATPPTNSAAPSVSGTARDGETLTADPGSWSGTEPIDYSYQWQRCTASGAPCLNIGEPSSSSTYTLTPTDVGATIRVEVMASNVAGSARDVSARTGPVAAAQSQDGAPVIAAAGDIACDPASISFKDGLGTRSACRQKYTSDLLTANPPSKVLALGDLQYNCGGYDAFLGSYDPSWGRLKSITQPIPGDEEYLTSGGTDCDGTGQAGGYFGYWGAAAGEAGKGYYSYDVGDWHVIALNANCSKVSCSSTSAQVKWLKADLAAHPRACTLAYYHYPRYYSNGQRSSLGTIWNELSRHRVDVVLAAHHHYYERFAPMDASGSYDPVNGIRQFIVGTGGKSRSSLPSTVNPNSEERDNTTYGVLKLTLGATGYDWKFVPEVGKTYSDSGSGTCSRDTSPPSAPQGLKATASSPTKVDLSWTASTDDVGVTGYEIYRDGALLGTTGAITSYADTTVEPGSTHTYEVRAHDAAGNRSAASDPVSATTPKGIVTVSPDADARVSEGSPGGNYGSATYLRTDGGSDPDVESLLRFPLTGVDGTVLSAKLRLKVTASTVDGPSVFANAGGWTESGVTWKNRPARISSAIDDKGALTSGTWVEYDVTPRVSGDGTYDFTLATPSTDAADFSSREVADAKPELVVAYR